MKSYREFSHVLALASIFALRMLGLFMIFPVFSSYAHHFQDYTPSLLGIALGIYGLTQALFQIPLGLSSDRFGRKPVITFGLLIFAFGSIVAAMSNTITGIIIGRALQGAGAIGSTLMATIADLTSEKNRTVAMAIIGLTIAITFAMAMVLGPLLTSYLSIKGIFWLTSLLALSGILILYTLVPNSTSSKQISSQSLSKTFKSVLSDLELLRLNIGIFSQHAILTATFVIIPIILTHQLNLLVKDQWLIYLPILFFSFISAIPFIMWAEKNKRIKPVFLGAVIIISLSQFALTFTQQHLWLISINLFCFFCGFNLLEASLPSLVSKAAPTESKGTAMGVYSCSQFLGIFVGGALGGWIYGHFSINSVFYANAALALLWFIIANSMQTTPAVERKLSAIS